MISDPSIAIVTPSYNRSDFLVALHESLCAQSENRFEWIVIDDASVDDTGGVVKRLAARSPFSLRLLSNEVNKGKAASLNHAFRVTNHEFYLVVDSDDLLHPNAVADVLRAVEKYRRDRGVGAIVFRYELPDGTLLGPSISASYRATRSKSDSAYGKYDGAVGYFKRALSLYRYPEFPGENYVGPTVLQLEMEDRFDIAFESTVIGTARYQVGGLSHQGRTLRLNNPLGMMHYSRLMVLRSPRAADRIKHGVAFWAYAARSKAGLRPRAPEDYFLSALGRALNLYWDVKYKQTVNM